MNNETYLQHHGILGQKWGVRRYQNFDGSYTQAGLNRYNKSKESYENAKESHKMIKSLKKHGMELSDGTQVNITKNVVKESKNAVKIAKRQMNKDYKHLAQDKKADKGKERYSKGERITDNYAFSNAMKTIGGLTITAAAYGYNAKVIDTKIASAMAGIGAATVAGGFIYGGAKEHANNQLRDYYAHTSKY